MKLKLLTICCLYASILSAQPFASTTGFGYKQGAISSYDGSEWVNQQDFFANEFSFTLQKRLANNLYLNTGIGGGDRKGYFNTAFAFNAIAKDMFLEIPLGLKHYTPLAGEKLYLSVGIDGIAGVSVRQDRYFAPGLPIPGGYESTSWLSNVNLGLGGEAAVLYSLTEKWWASFGIASAIGLANFSGNDNYEAARHRRRFLSFGLTYVRK
jgi:hypothetical protein